MPRASHIGDCPGATDFAHDWSTETETHDLPGDREQEYYPCTNAGCDAEWIIYQGPKRSEQLRQA